MLLIRMYSDGSTGVCFSERLRSLDRYMDGRLGSECCRPQYGQRRFEMGWQGSDRNCALHQLSKTGRDAAEVNVRFLDRRCSHGSRCAKSERRSAGSLRDRWQVGEWVDLRILESWSDKR